MNFLSCQGETDVEALDSRAVAVAVLGEDGARCGILQTRHLQMMLDLFQVVQPTNLDTDVIKSLHKSSSVSRSGFLPPLTVYRRASSQPEEHVGATKK